MAFAKAKPQQARLKVSLYGPPGSGKTYTTLLFAEGLAKSRKQRIAFVDTERGTDFYAQPRPHDKNHPKAFDFDALYTRSIAEVLESVKGLDPKTHGIIVIDSITHMWQGCIEAYEGKMTSADTIPMTAWGKIKRPYKDLMNFLMACPFDVFILGRQKNVFSGDSGGELKMVGVGMKAEGETQYEPHISLRMSAVQDKQDPSKATYLLHGEKDRTSVLAGRTISNPTFENTIAPILPLLGEVQAGAEDEDERLAKDSELQEKATDKKKAKLGKSSELFATFQASVIMAQTTEDLGVIAADLKKQKRYLIEEHLDSLRVLFDERRRIVVETTVGNV